MGAAGAVFMGVGAVRPLLSGVAVELVARGAIGRSEHAAKATRPSESAANTATPRSIPTVNPSRIVPTGPVLDLMAPATRDVRPMAC